MAKTKKKPKKKKVVPHKFELYHESVQDPDSEIKFMKRIFKKRYDKAPRDIREDFCGTAWLCAEWVKKNEKNTAVGVDICTDTLNWGREHIIAPIGDNAKRLTLLNEDVLKVKTNKVDAIFSLNFSYCVFKERKILLDYAKAARTALRPQGIHIFDLYGGPEAMQLQTEPRDCEGFEYIWDQDEYWPITGETRCFIHFKVGKKKVRRAFEYNWRLWGLPEMVDILRDAGYSHVEVFWEGSDKDGEGTGVFKQSRRGTPDDCWVAYIIAYNS